ncbi:hypothetical protein [Halococcus thailandensis]|uniref:Type I phosphodiesterase/nucleotide pyrophosphatase n=1 Tax=Halococcus thailandensis JCM 13552 TaxID=1227457 RepID=M0N6F3_9EURY|nr:hypothetical protein [Halococcus thailandensis]EMA53123.1 hypothetical protein C451_10017 [Halococcus thailandensis JCM 13552]
MTGTTVVLGWDGLDRTLVEEYDLTEAFGPHYSALETFENPVLGKPHTYELWPSIITGRRPAEHYRRRGIPTVFDGRAARPIAIPNYRVPRDYELDIVFDRGEQFGRFLTAGERGTESPALAASVPRLEERLAGEATRKLGIVRAALQREYDLLFVWLGFVDTVGHLAPIAGAVDPGWQERTYRLAADWTRELRTALGADDRLLCVSDHGIREGHHTPDAFVGSTEEEIPESTASVLDVRAAIDRVTPTGGDVAEPELKATHRTDERVRVRTAADVQQQLDGLGYL